MYPQIPKFAAILNGIPPETTFRMRRSGRSYDGEPAYSVECNDNVLLCRLAKLFGANEYAIERFEEERSTSFAVDETWSTNRFDLPAFASLVERSSETSDPFDVTYSAGQIRNAIARQPKREQDADEPERHYVREEDIFEQGIIPFE